MHAGLPRGINLQETLRSPGGGSVRLWKSRDERLARRGPTSTTMWGQLQPMTPKPSLDRPSLYELAKIDRDRYTVLGIDLRVDGSTTASIYAIDSG